MTIEKVEITSYEGMLKISCSEGSAFYIRKEYLLSVCGDDIVPGAEFYDSDAEEIVDAGLAAAVEFKAVEYLARAEQCRFILTSKLVKKGYEKKYIDAALDFLESRNLLSDLRYARAWLNSRKINHYEGRTRLIAELSSRGIDRETASSAVDVFFEENDEDEICRCACEKLGKTKSGDKLIAALLKSGFSYKQIVQNLNTLDSLNVD